MNTAINGETTFEVIGSTLVREEEMKNQGEAGREHRATPSAEMETHPNVSAVPSFTPGPWQVDDRRSAPLPNILIRGADNSHVAQAEGVHMRDKMLRWSPQDADRADRRAMTNALLIAAAPALYAALRLYVDHFGDPLKVARAALALANGQATNTAASAGTTDQD